ncbi:MAG: cation:proton antiporter [Treponema sp.]|nr:cation:proton antiporter [Treponema sp.]
MHIETESATALAAIFALQLGIILFAVRFFGKLAKKTGFPQVIGELVAGILISPYALGGISMPGFPEGVFALNSPELAVSNELYSLAAIASIILLFASGLETNIPLFLRYSLRGGIIGVGGVIASFVAGSATGVLLLGVPFTHPQSLFLGIMLTATSMGIAARILSDQKNLEAPEKVTIFAASVFDDVLSIIGLAVVLGIVTMLTGSSSGGPSVSQILATAGKAFGIWLGVTTLGLVFSKKLAAFLKIFRDSFDFSILAFGVALILAGIFEQQGLAKIIGAYIAGLALSKTDIADVIQERIRGLYEFFVPVFFAVMGMMVNAREFLSPSVLIFGAVYTVAAILSKVVGCGAPALLLGFNTKGALRIGSGMVPRGEVTLIMAGIGMVLGVVDQKLFAAIVLMILATTLAAPALLGAAMKLRGSGTRKSAPKDDTTQAVWKFPSAQIADLVMDTLLKDLRNEGFYVQMMNINEGISHARKDDIVLSIKEEENIVTIETAAVDMPLVKTAVYEVIVTLNDSIQKLKASSDPKAMRCELAECDGRLDEELLALITPDCIRMELSGETKAEVIRELVDVLGDSGKIVNRDEVLADMLEREKIMSTGMQNGIALPHAKTCGTSCLAVAVGIKKAGVDFDCADGEKAQLFIAMASPKKVSGPHVQFLAAISTVLHDADVREAVINAATADEAAQLLRQSPRKR